MQNISRKFHEAVDIVSLFILQRCSLAFPTIRNTRHVGPRCRLSIDKIELMYAPFKISLKFAAGDCYDSRWIVVRKTVRKDQANIIQNLISCIVLEPVYFIPDSSEVHRVLYNIEIVQSLQYITILCQHVSFCVSK